MNSDHPPDNFLQENVKDNTNFASTNAQSDVDLVNNVPPYNWQNNDNKAPCSMMPINNAQLANNNTIFTLDYRSNLQPQPFEQIDGNIDQHLSMYRQPFIYPIPQVLYSHPYPNYYPPNLPFQPPYFYNPYQWQYSAPMLPNHSPELLNYENSIYNSNFYCYPYSNIPSPQMLYNYNLMPLSAFPYSSMNNMNLSPQEINTLHERQKIASDSLNCKFPQPFPVSPSPTFNSTTYKTSYDSVNNSVPSYPEVYNYDSNGIPPYNSNYNNFNLNYGAFQFPHHSMIPYNSNHLMPNCIPFSYIHPLTANKPRLLYSPNNNFSRSFTDVQQVTDFTAPPDVESSYQQNFLTSLPSVNSEVIQHQSNSVSNQNNYVGYQNASFYDNNNLYYQNSKQVADADVESFHDPDIDYSSQINQNANEINSLRPTPLELPPNCLGPIRSFHQENSNIYSTPKSIVKDTLVSPVLTNTPTTQVPPSTPPHHCLINPQLMNDNISPGGKRFSVSNYLNQSSDPEMSQFMHQSNQHSQNSISPCSSLDHASVLDHNRFSTNETVAVDYSICNNKQTSDFNLNEIKSGEAIDLNSKTSFYSEDISLSEHNNLPQEASVFTMSKNTNSSEVNSGNEIHNRNEFSNRIEVYNENESHYINSFNNSIDNFERQPYEYFQKYSEKNYDFDKSMKSNLSTIENSNNVHRNFNEPKKIFSHPPPTEPKFNEFNNLNIQYKDPKFYSHPFKNHKMYSFHKPEFDRLNHNSTLSNSPILPIQQYPSSKESKKFQQPQHYRAGYNNNRNQRTFVRGNFITRGRNDKHYSGNFNSKKDALLNKQQYPRNNFSFSKKSESVKVVDDKVI